MTDAVTLGKTAWREWEDDGLPSSGAHRPKKAEIRAFVEQLGKSGAWAPTTSGARGVDMAMASEQWASGTVTGPTTLNHFKVWADDVNATNGGGHDYFVAAWTFDRYFGGSSARGGRTGVAVHQYLTAATNAANDNRNYTALSGVMTANASDGGTDPASASTSRGALFGAGLVAVALSGAIALLNATGCEFNVAMQAGSSVWAKSLAQFSARSDDAVAGSGIDAMLWLYNQNPSGPKWRHGILFDDSGSYGTFPFDTNSTVLEVTGPGGSTIGTGIDFNDVTITGNAFQCAAFSFGTGAGGNGYLEIGGVNKTPLIDFHSGSSLIDYDVRISAAGGNGTLGQGALNITAATTTLSGTLKFGAKSIVSSPADGNLLATNAAGTSFGMWQFGGTTSSFPALKRSGANVEARLADDTDYTDFLAKSLTATRSSGDNVVSVVSAAGNNRVFRMRSGSFNSWDIGANSEAQSGGNAGSNFYISSYDDGGGFIATPFVMLRKNGYIGLSGVNPPLARLHVAGTAVSDTSWTTVGRNLHVGGGTTTDTSGSGTIATRVGSSFGQPVFASSSAVTLTEADTLYIVGPPIAGTNTTITAGYALRIGTGNSLFGGNVEASSYKVGGNQVVGARDTGWTAMTGTTNENTAYDTSTVTLPQLAGRVMALQAALTTHGLIGT